MGNVNIPHAATNITLCANVVLKNLAVRSGKFTKKQIYNIKSKIRNFTTLLFSVIPKPCLGVGYSGMTRLLHSQGKSFENHVSTVIRSRRKGSMENVKTPHDATTIIHWDGVD